MYGLFFKLMAVSSIQGDSSAVDNYLEKKKDEYTRGPQYFGGSPGVGGGTLLFFTILAAFWRICIVK